MSTTDQLPEPELGYIQTDKSNQPAFSARQMREALQARAQVQGEPVGFTYQAEIEYADSTGGNGAFWRVPPDLDDEAVPLYTRPAPSVPDYVLRYAERYRYLRDIRRLDSIVLRGPEAGVWCDAEDEDGTLLLLTEGDLDEAIDAAMLAAK